MKYSILSVSFGILLLTTLFLGCTDLEFTNPIDPNSENYVGDDLARFDPETGQARYFNQDVQDSLANIGDTIPPVIRLLIERDGQLTEEGADIVYVEKGDSRKIEKLERELFQAMDGQGRDITANVRYESNVEVFEVGQYAITYTVISTRHTTTVERIVIVYEEAEIKYPVLTLIGESVITFITGDYYDPGADAHDPNQDRNISHRIEHHDEPAEINQYTLPGTYTRTYTVSNDAGLYSSRVRTFIIQEREIRDTTPPIIVLLGDNPLHIIQGEVYHEPGIKATDNQGNDISAHVTSHTNLDIHTPDTYYIEYSVSDANGNYNAATRHVVVEPKIVEPTTLIILNGEEVRYWQRGVPYVDIDPAYTLPNPEGVDVFVNGLDVPVDREAGYEHTITYTAVHHATQRTEIVSRKIIIIE
ncbi:hypothetical protein CHISP_2693 [Chitinispirillum alkaliphilum]|nr:hypothetical protein CHISP_2693 [Chitinispirillum alkaliphilum]